MTNKEIAIRNYKNGNGPWTLDMLINLVNRGKLTTDEYKEIVGSAPISANLDVVKSNKIIKSKEMLEEYLIENPMVWVDGNTYSVTQEKQNLLTSQLALYQTAIATGQECTLHWNTSGGVCTEWTYENLTALALSIGAYVQPLVSYQQVKEVSIMACETVEDVESIIIDYATLS